MIRNKVGLKIIKYSIRNDLQSDNSGNSLAFHLRCIDFCVRIFGSNFIDRGKVAKELLLLTALAMI